MWLFASSHRGEEEMKRLEVHDKLREKWPGIADHHRCRGMPCAATRSREIIDRERIG